MAGAARRSGGGLTWFGERRSGDWAWVPAGGIGGLAWVPAGGVAEGEEVGGEMARGLGVGASGRFRGGWRLSLIHI